MVFLLVKDLVELRVAMVLDAQGLHGVFALRVPAPEGHDDALLDLVESLGFNFELDEVFEVVSVHMDLDVAELDLSFLVVSEAVLVVKHEA